MSLAITLTSSPNPVKACHEVVITATVATATSGSVVFFIDGEEGIAPVAVSGAGVATLTRKFKRCPKSHVITAYYLPADVPTATLVQNISKC